MNYPPAVLEKAQRLEQLLLRVAAGESLEYANEALGFQLNQDRLARAQTRYELGGRTWQALIDGRYGHSRKAHSALREWLYTRKEQDDWLRAPQLVQEIYERFGVTFSEGHINYLLRKRGLSAPPGHPYPPRTKGMAAEVSPTPAASVDHAGVFFPGGCKSGDGPGSGG